MGPIIGLWRDTWWVWIVLIVVVVALSVTVTWFYWLFVPVLPGIFLYFAYNRYDQDGNERPDVDR